ncbi:hypothetical protein PSPO01_00265 [Paraphaeosphaeria sporulosa]
MMECYHSLLQAIQPPASCACNGVLCSSNPQPGVHSSTIHPTNHQLACPPARPGAAATPLQSSEEALGSSKNKLSDKPVTTVVESGAWHTHILHMGTSHAAQRL